MLNSYELLHINDSYELNDIKTKLTMTVAFSKKKEVELRCSWYETAAEFNRHHSWFRFEIVQLTYVSV